MAMTFDADFEESILAQALRDPDYVKMALRICDTHHFGTAERAWLWGVISDTWNKYKELPPPKLVVYRARDDFPDEDKRETYLKIAKKLYRIKPASPRSALEELEKFVKFVEAQLALEKATDALEKGDTDAAFAAMSAASRTVIGTRKYTLIHWIEEFEERQAARKYEKEHPGEFTAIPTGWKTVDAITGGLRIGELELHMGTTGRGKSIALNNRCYHAASRGYETLYISFEMPARQVASRGDSRWLGIDYKSLKDYELTPSDLRAIKARHDKAKKHFAGKFKVASFPVRSANMMDVRGLLDDLWAEFEWRPKLIAFDSGDHLKAIDTLKESFRLQQTEVYWAMKALGEEDGYAIASSVHAGKDWVGTTATTEAAGESYDKSRIADAVYSYNDPDYKKFRKKAKVEVSDDSDDDDSDDEFEVPEEAPRERKLDLHIAKYRDGESKRTIKMIADFHKMLIREAA